jgi:hypothetical protein
VQVARKRSDGPGITDILLTTRRGDLRIHREDGREATLSVPDQPDRPVALRRRDVPELLSEELRRLDPDDIYAATVRRMMKMHSSSTAGGKPGAKGTSRATTSRSTARTGGGSSGKDA